MDRQYKWGLVVLKIYGALVLAGLGIPAVSGDSLLDKMRFASIAAFVGGFGYWMYFCGFSDGGTAEKSRAENEQERGMGDDDQDADREQDLRPRKTEAVDGPAGSEPKGRKHKPLAK